MPDWAHVWFWMRFLRSTRDMTPLPQQEWHPDAMSMDRYELYEAEWQEAGAPRTTPTQVVAAMGAVTFEDDIPF